MKYESSELLYDAICLNIRDIFNQANRNIWDKRNKINVVHIADTDVLIKSFKIPHIINKIAYSFFRDSKAKRSYIHSLKILEFVPKPIGYVEFFRFGLLHDSYFISEEYAYDFTIREVLTQEDYPDKLEILKQFADFSYVLHNHKIDHLDYSPGNILIKKVNDTMYEFKIIDVNRMKFKEFSDSDRLENFSKLSASNEDLETIAHFYATHISMPKEEAYEIALRASQLHHSRRDTRRSISRWFKSKS